MPKTARQSIKQFESGNRLELYLCPSCHAAARESAGGPGRLVICGGITTAKLQILKEISFFNNYKLQNKQN